MHRSRTRAIAGAAVLLIAPLLALASVEPSGALPPGASSSCKAGQNPGAEMGHFPAAPSSQSQLKISCLFESDSDFAGGGGYPAGSAVSSAFTVHDFDQAVYHNGAGRVITATGGASGGNTISMAAVFADPDGAGALTGDPITTWVNRAITGTGIAPRTFVTSITSTTLTLSENLTANAAGQYRIDNAPGARSIDSGTLSDVAGVTHVTTVAGVGTSANFTAADVGLSLSTTRIPNGGCTITAVTTANDASLSCTYNGAPASFGAQVITIGGTAIVSNHRRVDDAISGAANTATRVSTAAGRNATSDIGLRVYGTGLDADTTVQTVSGAGNLHLNLTCAAPPCNNNAASVAIPNLRIGDDTGTAMADGDSVADVGVMLDLAPLFVAGSQACSAEEPEGFHIEGEYRSAVNFSASAFGGTIPAAVRTIGQIHFPNPTGQDFSAYVVQRPGLTAGDPVTNEHYDIVFPSLPVTVATCPQDPDGAGPQATTDYDAPGQGLSLTIAAQTLSTSNIPTGVGRPATAQFRALKEAPAGYTSNVYIESNTATVWTPTANFTRSCIYAAPSVVSFVCGNG